MKDTELVEMLEEVLDDAEDCEVCIQAGRETSTGHWYLVSTCPDGAGKEVLLVCDNCRMKILAAPLDLGVACVPCGDGHPKIELKVVFEKRI